MATDAHSHRKRWSRRFSLLLFSAAGIARSQSPSHSSAPASITSPPSYFEGWYMAGGSAEMIYCDPTLTYSVDLGVGRCCPSTGDCAIATACVDSTMFLEDGSSYTCASPLSCYSMTIFDASPSAGPTAINFLCAGNWLASTIYRSIPGAIAVTALPTSHEAAMLIPGSASSTSASLPQPASPSALPAPASSPSSSNHNWVVVPIVSFATSIFVLGLVA